jgi:acyl-coenzyme A synthetase/AMP-(fatty) acid ligase
VLFLDAFPLTVTGKIQKFMLRRHAAEVLEADGKLKAVRVATA